jgi:hypothetical protein
MREARGEGVALESITRVEEPGRLRRGPAGATTARRSQA